MYAREIEVEVTPSPLVDEFWHHHITFNTSWYRKFCTTIFGGYIHHSEGDGTEGSLDLHNRLYAGTLKLYKEKFGVNPPKSIWPDEFDPSKYLYKAFNVSKIVMTKTMVKLENDKYLKSVEDQYLHSDRIEECKREISRVENQIAQFQIELELRKATLRECEQEALADMQANNSQLAKIRQIYDLHKFNWFIDTEYSYTINRDDSDNQSDSDDNIETTVDDELDSTPVNQEMESYQKKSGFFATQTPRPPKITDSDGLIVVDMPYLQMEPYYNDVNTWRNKLS